MSFDVASIHQSRPGTFTPPNFPLGPDDAYAPTGGILTADFPLEIYIEFAYKLWLTPDQRRSFIAQLPKWAASDTDSYTIHARAAASNPTKDQMRLMMQALLADRFRLAVHFENNRFRCSPPLSSNLVSSAPNSIPMLTPPLRRSLSVESQRPLTKRRRCVSANLRWLHRRGNTSSYRANRLPRYHHGPDRRHSSNDQEPGSPGSGSNRPLVEDLISPSSGHQSDISLHRPIATHPLTPRGQHF